MNRTAANQWYVEHELQRVVARCNDAAARAAHARNLREAVQSLHVHCPSWLRSLARSDELRVQRAVEARALTLLNEQFAALKALTAEDREQQIGLLRQTEWVHLRGNLPRLCHEVEHRLTQLRAHPTKAP
jgi:hypothetical protein